MRHASALLLLTLFSLPAAAFDCPTPMPGLRDIKTFGYYTDAAGSIRDEAKFKESHAASKPFEDFAGQASKLSDRYLAKNEPAAAACTIAWLDRWAQDGAMLGTMVRVNNDQSEYVRQWTHGAAAVAWNKVRDQAGNAERSRIDAWLKALAQANFGYWTSHPKAKRNNHFYWTGVGIMATAVATGDAELLAKARQIYDSGLDEIRADGTLPMEMARGIRALHYHNYAAMPLAMIAEMARKVNQDWFGLRERRFDLLAQRVAAGLREPASFEPLAGAGPQIVPPPHDRAWVLLYRAHAQGERFDGLFGDADNAYFRDLGGDLRQILAQGVFNPR